MMTLKYVDLGAKKAGALMVARKRGPSRGLPEAAKRDCLAVERLPRYRQFVEKAGYRFVQADVLGDFLWPWADVYLAFNFLEHLPDLDASQSVLANMFRRSRRCVWLLLPSFEEEALARLRKLGYEFPWVCWPNHRAHVQLKHVEEVAARFKVKERKLIYRWLFKDCEKLRALEGVEQKPQALKPPLPGGLEVMYYLE